MDYNFSKKPVTALSHITTQPWYYLSGPIPSCLFFFPRGHVSPRSGSVYQDRRTDYTDACQRNDVTKKGGSPTWFELLLGQTKRERRRARERERERKRVVVPLYAEGHRCFYRLQPTDRPTDLNTGGRLSVDWMLGSAVSYVALSRLNGHADAAASINKHISEN